jgi:hypothetical protein
MEGQTVPLSCARILCSSCKERIRNHENETRFIDTSDFSATRENSYSRFSITSHRNWLPYLVDSWESNCGGIIAFRPEFLRDRIILLSFSGQSLYCFLSVANITDCSNVGVVVFNMLIKQGSRRKIYFVKIYVIKKDIRIQNCIY